MYAIPFGMRDSWEEAEQKIKKRMKTQHDKPLTFLDKLFKQQGPPHHVWSQPETIGHETSANGEMWYEKTRTCLVCGEKDNYYQRPYRG